MRCTRIGLSVNLDLMPLVASRPILRPSCLNSAATGRRSLVNTYGETEREGFELVVLLLPAEAEISPIGSVQLPQIDYGPPAPVLLRHHKHTAVKPWRKGGVSGELLPVSPAVTGFPPP